MWRRLHHGNRELINSNCNLYLIDPRAFFFFNLQKKTLDLRYNEMWQAWNDTAAEEDVNNSTSLFKEDLVLSWKQLNVTVVKKNPKLFGRSKIVHQKILDNGKN